MALGDQEKATSQILGEINALLGPVVDLFNSLGCGHLFESRPPSVATGHGDSVVEAEGKDAEGKTGGKESEEDDDSSDIGDSVSQAASPVAASVVSRGAAADSPPSSGMGMYLISPALRDTVQKGITSANVRGECGAKRVSRK